MVSQVIKAKAQLKQLHACLNLCCSPGRWKLQLYAPAHTGQPSKLSSLFSSMGKAVEAADEFLNSLDAVYPAGWRSWVSLSRQAVVAVRAAAGTWCYQTVLMTLCMMQGCTSAQGSRFSSMTLG